MIVRLISGRLRIPRNWTKRNKFLPRTGSQFQSLHSIANTSCQLSRKTGRYPDLALFCSHRTWTPSSHRANHELCVPTCSRSVQELKSGWNRVMQQQQSEKLDPKRAVHEQMPKTCNEMKQHDEWAKIFTITWENDQLLQKISASCNC